MNDVIPFRVVRRPRQDHRLRFALARREMNRAFAVWLNTKPKPADVQLEIETTLGVLRQLRELVRGDE